MRVLDLFSGIGGFSLGLERAGNFRTVAFCDNDRAAQKVLRKHWPGVPVFSDVRDSKIRALKGIDLICGGFPCQDISEANTRGEALDGARSGLWFEYLNLIKELRPKYAIIENVQMLRTRGLGTILSNLNEIGYDAEWHCIQASSIGAPHRRDRLWIIAYPMRVRRNPILGGDIIPRHAKTSNEGTKSWEWNTLEWVQCNSPSACVSQYESGFSESSLIRMDDGVPKGLDVGRRLKQLGNSLVPQIVEIMGVAIMQAESERIEDSRWMTRVRRWWQSTIWPRRAIGKVVSIPASVGAHTSPALAPNRWQCGGCTRTTTSSGLTNHQKVSGHVGRTNLNEVPVNVTRRVSEAVVESTPEIDNQP